MASDETINQGSLLQTLHDGELVRMYTKAGSEAAFSELVRRYAGLVFATCLRETGDRTMAEDASQSSFLLLCRKAPSLQNQESLAGWLFTASRYVAKNLVKQERRKKMSEARAMANVTMKHEMANSLWDRIEPHLHDALDRLKPADREAVLLRYVANQSFAEVGLRLGLSENTARMRVGRAIERIRNWLETMGIAVSSGQLLELMQERASVPTPTHLIQAFTKLVNSAEIVNTSLPDSLTIIRIGLRTFPAVSRYVLLTTITSLMILGYWSYQRMPSTLSFVEQQKVFTSMSGAWVGTLEYADDVTHQHFSFPSTVTVRLLPTGEGIDIEARYKGTDRIDKTTLRISPKTGMATIENGGSKSSHRLNSFGSFKKLPNGGFAFEGKSLLSNEDSRLLIAETGNKLTLQEEYRKPDQSKYQFRNRFTLTKP